MVGKLNLSLYGTRDAAQNWAATYTKQLLEIGFEAGKASPCNFVHRERGISTTIHGDDYTSVGREGDLRWLDGKVKEAFETKTKFLGPDSKRGRETEVKILNRVLTWGQHGVTYGADQRHGELIIKDLGLETAKGVTTPGTREDVKKADQENEGDDQECDGKEATLYRGICARLNYLAQDRPDIAYSSSASCVT